MREFVSEPIAPVSSEDSLRTDALARGEPSLPSAFRWRGREWRVVEILSYGRGLRRESFSGETYLGRHEWRLRMEADEVWSVYFVRHGPASRPAATPRWFLKTRERAGAPDDPEPPRAGHAG